MFSFHMRGELKYSTKDDETRNRGSSASFQVTKITHHGTNFDFQNWKEEVWKERLCT